ncbi:MAG: adenine phosphoribosyltransferase [Candidatus Lokiarchaeota archaeon]|nr:adenine phosphoribosyltransferase [Candidatus Lokiarchaeota archaeon]
MDLSKYIRNVPNWPKHGVQFKDITTLCKEAIPFRETCERIANQYKEKKIIKVAAIEARGYVFGGVVAYLLGVGFVLIRKIGKLPYTTIDESYELEYGSDSIHMHIDAISSGDKVLILDDLLATGGTAAAACRLVEKAGGIVEGLIFVIELTGSLHGRDNLKGYDIHSLIKMPVEDE